MSFDQTITLTFGDRAENHVGMQQIGQLAQQGLTVLDLQHTKLLFESDGCECELVNLNPSLEFSESAFILIVRKATDMMLSKIGKSTQDLFDEQNLLTPDKKALMYGRVVNKHARHNLCYDDVEQLADYVNGKGTIIAYDNVPLTKHVLDQFRFYYVGDKGRELKGEGNFYFDLNKCGISWHGDAERRVVMAVRLGATFPLYYQWFFRNSPVGERIDFELHHGDAYFMSEKATGFDWKKSSIYTLRHAAAKRDSKYLNIKLDRKW